MCPSGCKCRTRAVHPSCGAGSLVLPHWECVPVLRGIATLGGGLLFLSLSAATEADQVEMVICGQPSAISTVRACKVEVVEPGTASHDAPALLSVVPPFRPLPYIADHVDRPGWRSTVRVCTGRLRPRIPLPSAVLVQRWRIAATGHKGVTVTVVGMFWSAAGHFPLTLRTQTLPPCCASLCSFIELDIN